MPNYKSLGLVFLKKPTRSLCNAILVQKRWSAAPGLCVAARSEPHLSDLLPYWAIKYKTESGTFFVLVKMPNYKSLGLVFLKKPTRSLCNAILVQKRWSAAPGLCVAARSEPHLSDLLPYWAIKYKTESGTFFELEIIRSITYPRFNKDDLDNNIGLFEHENFENVLMFTFPLNPINLEDDQIANNMDIISWDLVSNSKGAIVPHNDVIMRTPIKGPMLYDDCRMYLSAISDLRGHEICVVVEKQSDVELVQSSDSASIEDI
nr:unnamed protein product [Amyelois transitella]